MRQSKWTGVAFLAGALLLGACNPSCENTCRKVLECDNLDSDRIAIGECKLECQSQERLWDDWVDETELDNLFMEHKRCLVQSTCDEIEAGECYDDELFHFGTDTTTLSAGTTDTAVSTP